MTTLEDLEVARAELARWQDRFANDRSNNPNKHRSSIRSASDRVAAIEAALKASGDLPRTETKELHLRLDSAFPDARSRQIVSFEGRRNQRRFTPARMSNSRKSVTRSSKWWDDLGPVAEHVESTSNSTTQMLEPPKR